MHGSPVNLLVLMGSGATLGAGMRCMRVKHEHHIADTPLPPLRMCSRPPCVNTDSSRLSRDAPCMRDTRQCCGSSADTVQNNLIISRWVRIVYPPTWHKISALAIRQWAKMYAGHGHISSQHSAPRWIRLLLAPTVVEKDCQVRGVNREDAMDRSRWMKHIRDNRWPRWVWVGECFFWYRFTRVVPDKIHRAVKRLCVCVCVCVCRLMWEISWHAGALQRPHASPGGG